MRKMVNSRSMLSCLLKEKTKSIENFAGVSGRGNVSSKVITISPKMIPLIMRKMELTMMKMIQNMMTRLRA